MHEGNVCITGRGAERAENEHLWIYRSDVKSADAGPGDIVRVKDERGRFIGRALYSDKSQIALRLLTRRDEPVDYDFFRRRIENAIRYRESAVADTQVCRLVYGEADLLPSLIVDRYGDYIVLQTLSQGTDRRKEMFVEILRGLCDPQGIVERNDPKVRLLEGLEQLVSVPYGEVPDELVLTINGVKFSYNLMRGQKTGGFLDQRENRMATAQYATGEVLDCFTYMGGFALTVAPRCEHVTAVDFSADAILRGRQNQELNALQNVEFIEANAFDFLKQCDEEGRQFDMVILDPPAFAKNRASIPAACRGYKEINLRALKILKPGGMLVTCTCSYHISEALFLEILASAAKDTRRYLSIVERRTQSRDHPILLTMPETLYLKCFIIKVL